MIVLDHNIPQDQTYQLRRWGVLYRQIGFEIGRPEWDDQQEILRFLHSSKQVTFFSRDLGFFRARLCHRNYCLAVLGVPVLETAYHVRALLRHRDFNTKAKRIGKVIRVSNAKITAWEMGRRHQTTYRW